MAMFKSLSEALKNSEQCTALKLTLKSPEFPAELFTLTNLQELYVEAPFLKTLPALGTLSQLQLLSLKAPVLQSPISELFLLPHLRNLKVLETPLEELTLKLQRPMAPLRFLTLKQCNLRKLPLELGEWQHLEELMLAHNHLSELPFTFNGLTKLKRLNLDSNAFTKFPDTISELPSLLHVSCDGNLFSEEEKSRIQRQFGLSPS